jgi:hypothetical protein
MSDVGRRFAYRERARSPGEPVRPVEVVKEGPPRSNKAKVRRLDGEYEGLEEWVPKGRLIAPWEEVEALLEDERRMFGALDATGDVYDTLPYKAVRTVFFALPPGEGGDDVFFGHKVIESELLNIEDLDAVERRLGLPAQELLAEPHSYVDRYGEYKAPFEVAVKVAKHCCRTFTQDILRYVQAEEDALKEAVVSGYYTFPDRRYRSWRDKDGFEILRTRAEEWLAEQKPIFALIREWCGEGAVDEFRQVLELREEVDRLRDLLTDTVRWLRDAGHPVKAALLQKQINRSDPDTKRSG